MYFSWKHNSQILNHHFRRVFRHFYNLLSYIFSHHSSIIFIKTKIFCLEDIYICSHIVFIIIHYADIVYILTSGFKNSMQGHNTHLAFVPNLKRMFRGVKGLLDGHAHVQSTSLSLINVFFFGKRPEIGNTYFSSCFIIHSSYLLIFLT